MMYTFNIQMEEVEYSASNKKYILKEDNYQRDKEYMLTLFSTYIDENKAKIKADGITESVSNTAGDIAEYIKIKSEKIKAETFNVSYSKENNEFTIITPYGLMATRNDYFKLEIIEEKFQMTFIRTEYHDSGR